MNDPMHVDDFRTGNAPAKQPALAVAHARLAKSISALEAATVELVARINPVLTPVAPVQMPTPVGPCGQNTKTPCSPLCNELDHLAMDVSQVTEIINNAIKRVEV